MHCPKCNYPRIRYNQVIRKKGSSRKFKPDPRTDFTVKCKKCGWEGEIR